MSSPAHPGKSGRSKPQAKKKKRPYRPPGSIPFPQAQGKTLEDVYLTADADLNSVTLCFDDNTELVVQIEPCLSFSADFSDWKTGDQRVIKSWPRVPSL